MYKAGVYDNYLPVAVLIDYGFKAGTAGLFDFDDGWHNYLRKHTFMFRGVPPGVPRTNMSHRRI